jgi:ribosomal protein S12 methylthiotransferase accessory factor
MAGTPYRIVLKDAFKQYTLDQDKALAPEETVRRFKKRLAKINLDILKGTQRIDNGRLGIPVYFSICGRDAQSVIGTKKQMGKGATPTQAEASAVMELAERFSFFSFSKNSQKRFTEEYRNLKDCTLPFESVALSVHDTSEDLDRAKEVFCRLPLEWTWAYNMTRDQEVLLPFNWFYAINQYNGPSAGNCVEEALLQGICEVVERHVSSIVAQNRLSTPAITPRSVTDPTVREIMRKYDQAGVRLSVSDLSLNTGLPTVGVLAFDPSTFPEKSEIVWTAGTTPHPEKALGRALTEVAQLAGDFNTGANYEASGLPKLKTLEEAEFVTSPKAEVDISHLSNLSHDNMRVEVENCISALAPLGMEVIVVDIKHSLLQIPAFYTIVPGAHFRERAAGTSVGMFSAKLITESGDPSWALSKLHEADKILPGKYYTKFYLGSCHLQMNAFTEALKYFEQALDLGPKEEDAASIYSYMGVCFKELGQYRQAIAALEKGEMFDRERTDIYNLMGFCYFKLKEHYKAIECFQQVLRMDPGSAIDYANIASNYRDAGERELAVHYYRLALELDPSIEFARVNLNKLQQA